MRRSFLIIISLFSLATFAQATVPVLQIADTINPGTADYIISEIENAERLGAPFLILQLDTPGGLLNSTRQIIQSMLNSHIPIVVWVGPKGARAGSAGALITFAADISAMAPGTNIGAAHPVEASGQVQDKVLAEKITNDTAAFAESLARVKGRNIEWAQSSVRNSSAISSEEALKLKVVDLIANDLDDLEIKLRGFASHTSKNAKGALPAVKSTLNIIRPTLKQQVVSFFANPTLAYLILSFGALCLWIELSHPGIFFPGILGALCLLISLVSFQLLPIRLGALGMLLLGIILLIIELYVPSYGALGIGGILAFVLGSLYLMDTTIPEFQISTLLIFPIATCFAIVVCILSFILLKTRRLKVTDSYLSLVGLFTEANTDITDRTGNVFLNGELWSARSADGTLISKNSKVLVQQVNGLVLTVILQEKKR
ncbi:MAG: nodulation protein NfeD [Bdellovibrionales bacterium]|nr:nodulation protein NfeD [Bdellovibrionales bacterium]